MEVDRRATSPDFAAGEAHFFRKLRAAFADLQKQYENEKVSSQRSFERNQQAIQQHIRDLEVKCSDLAERRRELEATQKETALELQQKKNEEIQGQRAYHEVEERRRRKYSALLGGGSATGLKIILVHHKFRVKRLLCSPRLKPSRLLVFNKVVISLPELRLVNHQENSQIRLQVAAGKRSSKMCHVSETGKFCCLVASTPA